MITIEVAERKHLPQILQLWQELMDYHAQLDPLFETRKDGAENWRRYLRGLMRTKEARVFIAIEDDEVIGYSPCRIASHPPVLKRETHLPVFADPSHAGGRRHLVAPLSYAAIAAGADGLLVEVHPEPEQATSDGDQSLDFSEFDGFMDGLRAFAAAAGRTMKAGGTPAEG